MGSRDGPFAARLGVEIRSGPFRSGAFRSGAGRFTGQRSAEYGTGVDVVPGSVRAAADADKEEDEAEEDEETRRGFWGVRRRGAGEEGLGVGKGR